MRRSPRAWLDRVIGLAAGAGRGIDDKVGLRRRVADHRRSEHVDRVRRYRLQGGCARIERQTRGVHGPQPRAR